jgi:hypothetical protein
MKFSIELKKETPLNFLRRCGYAPEGQDQKTGEFRFSRPLRGARYPRFHLYVNALVHSQTITLSLHLDQKQPSYQGSSAHSGEYDGALVEAETKRILSATFQ